VADQLTSRALKGEEDCKHVAKLLYEMYREAGRATLNPEKAWLEIVDTVENHAAFGVFHNDLLIASVGLIPLEGGLFYSDAPWFIDKWCYVLPQYRPHRLDSVPFEMLLREVQWLCNIAERAAIITVFNEKRVRVRDHVTRIAQKLAIYPAGVDIEIRPEGSAP
jgi:hypothetical protein